MAEEIWGDDVDTWVASPYAPQGVAKPVDGGYIFNGRWQFSSGTDHCDWIILGRDARRRRRQAADAAADAAHDPAAQGLRDRRGLVERGGAARNRLQGRHRQGRVRPDLPDDGRDEGDGRHRAARGRHDRDAVPDAVVDDVPAGHLLGRRSASPKARSAAHLDYQRDRVGANGTAIKDDPYVMYAIGEAAADINAARQELLANVDRIYDIVDAGKEVSFEDRAAGRRTQVRAAWRAVVGGRPDLRPLRRQRVADGQAAAAVSGATRTPAWLTPSTFPAPSTTRRR